MNASLDRISSIIGGDIQGARRFCEMFKLNFRENSTVYGYCKNGSRVSGLYVLKTFETVSSFY